MESSNTYIPEAMPQSTANSHKPDMNQEVFESYRLPVSHIFSGLPDLHFDDESSISDLSTSSEYSDHESDNQTDLTSPSASRAGSQDMRSDHVEDFRDEEYPAWRGRTYLDHGATTLFARSLVLEWANDQLTNTYGNPHSEHAPSALAGHRIDAIRNRTLRFFNADPEHFDLIFVGSGATASIKLVAECLRDYGAASNTPLWYGYHRDSHTSLVGIRELTKLHRCFTSDDEVDIWINSGGIGGPRSRQLGLFAYPGQSNMTGRRLPLDWPGRIRKTFHKAATYTLFDAAALACTAPLDLSDPATAPDFVAVAFYKIFGSPNLGGLIVRKQSAHVLESRRYFGGGTVEMVISMGDTWHAKKETSLHDRLEEGTPPFLSILELDHALNVHERLYGPNPMKFISHHTSQLGYMMYTEMSRMRHGNGSPVCFIYQDANAIYGNPVLQSATIAFNVLKADGGFVSCKDVELAANERNISVRSGSLCNPGGVADYLNWAPLEMKAAFDAGHRCTSPIQIVNGKPTGVVRVSLGAMNIAADVRIWIRFLRETYLDSYTGVSPQPTSKPPTLPTPDSNHHLSALPQLDDPYPCSKPSTSHSTSCSCPTSSSTTNPTAPQTSKPPSTNLSSTQTITTKIITSCDPFTFTSNSHPNPFTNPTNRTNTTSPTAPRLRHSPSTLETAAKARRPWLDNDTSRRTSHTGSLPGDQSQHEARQTAVRQIGHAHGKNGQGGQSWASCSGALTSAGGSRVDVSGGEKVVGLGGVSGGGGSGSTVGKMKRLGLGRVGGLWGRG